MPVPNPEMAVAICQDVLKQLKKRRYNKGDYVVGYFVSKDKPKDFQEIVGQLEQNCNVCLKGSLMLSKAKLYDNCPVEGIYRYGSPNEWGISLSYTVADEQLSPIFGAETIDLLEYFFEAWGRPSPGDKLFTLKLLAGYLGSQIPQLEDRVRIAMENCIANNGEFTLPHEELERINAI